MELAATIKPTLGSESDKGRKYKLSVAVFIASSLSQNENVEDYHIYSNLMGYHPFDDVVVEVHFKKLKRTQIYAIQVKSGHYNFDIITYLDGYERIKNAVNEERMQVWHFGAKNVEYFLRQHSKKEQLKVFGCKKYSNTDLKDILDNACYYKFHPNDSQFNIRKEYTGFFSNFYMFFDQPDTQRIHEIIGKKWNVDDSLHSYIEKYFTNNNMGLDKKSFEHELLRNRLYNYVVTPTKAFAFEHKAVNEWNRLTLTRDVTVVLNEMHTEEYLYGCMLQNKDISEIINIDQWNRFVENEGKLDDDVKNYFKEEPCKVETLKDLIFQRWVDGKIPLILRIDAWLPALKELPHLNKKYITIVSDIAGRSAEIESNQLKVFRHLGDAETEELTKNIPVSLQGREPTSLHEIINETEALKEAVTCLDIIHLMKPRKAYVNRKCLNGNDHMLFIIETENLPQRSLDEEQPSGTNIEIYCEPNKGGERYSEIRADPKFKSYKIFHLRLGDQNRLTLISKTHEHSTTQKDGERCGLECFFVDQNGERIYRMDNGDIIPIIGQVPIHARWRYIPRFLREGIKKDERKSVNEDVSNKFSIEYSKDLIAERDLLKAGTGTIGVIGEPGMGKTTLLHSLFYLCESKYYVIFVDLVQHQFDLRDGKLKSFEDLLRLTRHRCPSLPYNDLLKSLLDYTKRLVIILDSFDEIMTICEQQLLKFLRNLEELNLHNLIIASSFSALNQLINNFEVKLFRIERLSKQSDKDYSDIWNLDIHNLRHTPSEFLSNPLYLDMLRTIMRDQPNLGVRSRWQLYELVLKLKMEYYCQQRDVDENDKQRILTKHGELALKVVLGANKITRKLKRKHKSDLIRLGFITHFDNENPVFVHRTFAEFFIVKWLIDNVDHADAAYIYDLILDKKQADILNIHSEGYPLHKAVLDGDTLEVKRLSRENVNCLQEVDGLGRSALHLLVIHYSSVWEESDILEFLSTRMRQEGLNTDVRDKVMKWTCVEYFEKCKYIRDSGIYANFSFQEIYWNYYATHRQKLDGSKYSLSEHFNRLYNGAICNASISLLRNLLLLKYGQDEGCPIREMYLNQSSIKRRKHRHISLSQEMLKHIHLACIYSDMEAIRIHIRKGANFNKVDKFNCTPLHYSVIAGQSNEIIKLILENCEISKCGLGRDNETTILHICVRTGNVDVTKMVLEKLKKEFYSRESNYSEGLNIIKEILLKKDKKKYNPLEIAVEYGTVDLVKTLIEYYAAVNLVNMLDSAYFWRALMRRNIEIIKLLLEHGPNPNYVKEVDLTALEMAVKNGDEDIVRILLSNNANVNSQYGDTPLCSAITTQNLNIIKILLDHGADVNTINVRGRTPLLYAIKTEKADIVQLLLSYKADVNLRGKCDLIPLCTAMNTQRIEIIQMLLQNEARTDYTDSSGRTPLVYAIKAKMEEVVRILLDHGADVNWKDKHGRTSLYTAIKAKDANIVEILLNNQADVNFIDKYGRSPLLFAVSKGNTTIVKMLLDKNANVNFENVNGITAICIARLKEDTNMVDLLLEHGAYQNISFPEKVFRRTNMWEICSATPRLLRNQDASYPPNTSSGLHDLNRATNHRYLDSSDENSSDSIDEFSDSADES